MEVSQHSTQHLSTRASAPQVQTGWTAETIKIARKSRKLTQADLAFALGCRQQTISEWEVGMYGPKNAYQKLLDQFFATDGGGAKDSQPASGIPSTPAPVPDLNAGTFFVTPGELLGAASYMRANGLERMQIGFGHAQETFKMFGAAASN